VPQPITAMPTLRHILADGVGPQFGPKAGSKYVSELRCRTATQVFPSKAEIGLQK